MITTKPTKKHVRSTHLKATASALKKSRRSLKVRKSQSPGKAKASRETLFHCSLLTDHSALFLNSSKPSPRNHSATFPAPLPSLPFHVSCSMFRVSCSSPSPNPLISNHSPATALRPLASALRPFFSLPLLTDHCSLGTFFRPQRKKILPTPPSRCSLATKPVAKQVHCVRNPASQTPASHSKYRPNT